jgi:hypothetical protein
MGVQIISAYILPPAALCALAPIECLKGSVPAFIMQALTHNNTKCKNHGITKNFSEQIDSLVIFTLISASLYMYGRQQGWNRGAPIFGGYLAASHSYKSLFCAIEKWSQPQNSTAT